MIPMDNRRNQAMMYVLYKVLESFSNTHMIPHKLGKSEHSDEGSYSTAEEQYEAPPSPVKRNPEPTSIRPKGAGRKKARHRESTNPSKRESTNPSKKSQKVTMYNGLRRIAAWEMAPNEIVVPLDGALKTGKLICPYCNKKDTHTPRYCFNILFALVTGAKIENCISKKLVQFVEKTQGIKLRTDMFKGFVDPKALQSFKELKNRGKVPKPSFGNHEISISSWRAAKSRADSRSAESTKGGSANFTSAEEESYGDSSLNSGWSDDVSLSEIMGESEEEYHQ